MFLFNSKLEIFVFSFLSIFLLENVNAQSIGSNPVSIDSSNSTIPACESESSDVDGDGWGWENGTCHVGGEFIYRIHPTCKSSNSDSDGDGWGWENNQSEVRRFSGHRCLVNEQ